MDLSSSQGSSEPRGALYGSHHEMSSESSRMRVGSFNQARAVWTASVSPLSNQ